MKFKVLFWCVALSATIIQSSCSVAEEKVSVSKYSLRLLEGQKDFDEEIEIDTEKETETFHVPKTSPDEEAGDIIHDFKRKVTMIRLPATNACYLTNSIDDALKPADLRKALELQTDVTSVGSATAPAEIKLTIVGTLEDRSELSDEMVDLCAKLPIYEVVKGDVDPTDIPQLTDPPSPDHVPNTRVKRGWRVRRVVRKAKRLVCRNVCRSVPKTVCKHEPDPFGGVRRVCYTVTERVCSRVCSWVFG